MTLEEIRRLAADVARRPATATEAECSRALHSLATQLEAAEAEVERIRRGGDLETIQNLRAQLEAVQGREQWAQDRALMYAKQLEAAQEVIEAAQKRHRDPYGLERALARWNTRPTEHTPFLKWKYQDDHSH